ncbi:hypothetical protein BDZ89DRAFT_1044766 [Hymenopellis radicata]|nr:hypothetical protein BDZ89DRAFT_1044766 [Hymenopellis radicata]
MFSLSATAIAAVLSVAGMVSADSPATCSAHGFDLTSDDGKSPCYIASLMVGGGYMPEDSPYPSLSGQTEYDIPTADEADDLRCNPIFYTLVSGCSACQSYSSNTWPTWDSWTTNCGNITGVKYIAETMPYDTALPNWVFTDPVVTGGTFNYTAAKLVGASDEIPETTFNVKSESSSSTASSTAATCSNKAGAIAGAAVGSAVGGALIGALIMFLLVKKSKKTSADRGSIHSHESEDTVAREKKIANRA